VPDAHSKSTGKNTGKKLARPELSRAELMSMCSCVAGLEFMDDQKGCSALTFKG